MSETDGLIQLHWQNPATPSKTEFVAQGQFDDAREACEWAQQVVKRRISEMPQGWTPMICTWDSEYFVKAAK